MHIKHNDYQLTILRQFRKILLPVYTKFLSTFLRISICKTAHCNRHSDKNGIMFETRTIQRLSPPPIFYLTGHIKILIACCRWDDPFVSVPAEKMFFLGYGYPRFLGSMSFEWRKCISWVAVSFVLRCRDTNADNPRSAELTFSSLIP